MSHLHPDDAALFIRLAVCARDVAGCYDLPLTRVEPFPEPVEQATPLGRCYPTGGVIQMTLRWRTQAGEWTEPRPEADVWSTLAHELAHLKVHGHTRDFWDLKHELDRAVDNWRFRC